MNGETNARCNPHLFITHLNIKKNKSMKRPPDVIYFGDTKENPLLKWINLSNWAIDHNDKYLQQRASEMVLELTAK